MRRASVGALGAVISLGLLLGLMVFRVRVIGDYEVETDFYATYAPRAAQIAAGQFHPANYGVTGPLYEVLLAFWLRFGGAAYLGGKLISALATVGTLIVTVRLAQRLVPGVGARIAPWLLFLSPAFIRYGYVASTDALTLFCAAVSIDLFLAARTPPGAAAAGLAGLCAGLTRYSASSLIPWVIAEKFPLRPGGRKTLAYLALFPGGLVALVVVLTLLGVDLPQPLFLHNIGYAAQRGEQDWDSYTAGGANPGAPLDIVRSSPGRVGLSVLRGIPRHLAVEAGSAAGWPLAGLALVGVFGLLRSAPGAARQGMLGLVLLWMVQFLIFLPVQPSERYALVQVVIYALLGGWGVAGLLNRGSKTGPRQRGLAWALVGAIVVGGLVQNGWRQFHYQRRQPTELLELARQVADRVPAGELVVSRKPHLPFLIGSRWGGFPDVRDLNSLRQWLKEHQAHYLLFSGSEKALRPQFTFLTVPDYRPAGWEVVASDSARSTLYRITERFYRAPLEPDDQELRRLQNELLVAHDLVPPVRRLAAFLYATGRYREAARHYEGLARLTSLTPEERVALTDALRRSGL